jgi:hypothetical protein
VSSLEITVTIADLPAPPVAADGDGLAADLADLRARAQRASRELSDIHSRLAALEEQIRRHRERG